MTIARNKIARTDFVEFRAKEIAEGCWFVAIKTGKGPDSHIIGFKTKAEAQKWISTNADWWPEKPRAPRGHRER